jgi:hypothetical protein
MPFDDDKAAKKSIADFEQQVVSKMKAFYKSFDTDKYWAAACYNDRFLKSSQVFFCRIQKLSVNDKLMRNSQDICVENSAGHRNKACAVELNSTDVLKQAIAGSMSHPLLEVEWTCIGNNIDELDETTLEQFQVGFYQSFL